MKIFMTKQIAAIDQFTIQNEPIADIDLMERASMQIVNWLTARFSTEQQLIFFAGPGNNGGDAMAIARLMADYNYPCELYLLDFGKELMGSPAINWQRLQEQGKVLLKKISNESDIPNIPGDSLVSSQPCFVTLTKEGSVSKSSAQGILPNARMTNTRHLTVDMTLVVDGLFGSGLSRKLEGLPAKIVSAINTSKATVVAIDIPSGLLGEDNSQNDLNCVVRADFTLTFQFPKLAFFFPEHDQFLGQWEVLPIGLHANAIGETFSPYHYFTSEEVSAKIQKRSKFSHKGTYGHALLISGSYCKMGAAVLASRACLRSGVGLLTTHVPHSAYQIIQNSVPEAMCSIDASDLMFTEFPDLSQFSAIGVGPALGLKTNSQRALKELLLAKPAKLVLDADALNILSMHPEWLELLPENSILTPHPKEFERLAGATADSWSRLQAQLDFSKRYQVFVVLKGAHTCITFPSGEVYFNTTGNPGMATAGSGDALTGIILGLLAQQYPPADAAMIGVFVHGLAGDFAAKKKGEIALVASDLIDSLGKAFRHLTK
jgi:NAD(P)H-hydrate epimerase